LRSSMRPSSTVRPKTELSTRWGLFFNIVIQSGASG
jgi:hypothetical protein